MLCFNIYVKFGLKYFFYKDQPSKILNRHQEKSLTFNFVRSLSYKC
ncbi:hypothetical protein Nmel_002847 [Mimus melanotis]